MTLAIDRPTERTVAAITALTESPFQAGYCAYLDRRGPGIGRLRNAGWLQARKDFCAEMRQRADERLDTNEYRWMY